MATGQLASAQYFPGLSASDTLDHATAAMDALDDAELAGCLDVGRSVGAPEMAFERHASNVAHCERVIDVARSTGQGAALLDTMATQAWSLISLGRLDEAEERLSAAIEMGYLAPHFYHGLAMAFSTSLATHRGNYAAAVRVGEESVRLARSADENVTWRGVPMVSGECADRAGRGAARARDPARTQRRRRPESVEIRAHRRP